MSGLWREVHIDGCVWLDHDLLVHIYNKSCCNTSNKMKNGGEGAQTHALYDFESDRHQSRDGYPTESELLTTTRSGEKFAES